MLYTTYPRRPIRNRLTLCYARKESVRDEELAFIAHKQSICHSSAFVWIIHFDDKTTGGLGWGRRGISSLANRCAPDKAHFPLSTNTYSTISGDTERERTRRKLTNCRESFRCSSAKCAAKPAYLVLDQRVPCSVYRICKVMYIYLFCHPPLPTPINQTCAALAASTPQPIHCAMPLLEYVIRVLWSWSWRNSQVEQMQLINIHVFWAIVCMRLVVNFRTWE